MASDEPDAYAVCRYVKHYHQKNGYAPTIEMIGALHVTLEYLEQLVKNGVVTLQPICENGPAIKIFLTDKGYRMADGRR